MCGMVLKTRSMVPKCVACCQNVQLCQKCATWCQKGAAWCLKCVAWCRKCAPWRQKCAAWCWNEQSPNPPFPPSPNPPIPYSMEFYKSLGATDRPTDGKGDGQPSRRTRIVISRQSPQFLGLCKNALLLVLIIEEISLWPELSSPPRFRIQRAYPKRDTAVVVVVAARQYFSLSNIGLLGKAMQNQTKADMAPTPWFTL